MKKIILLVTSIVFLYSCDTTFKVEKMISDNRNRTINETYLVSNIDYSSKVNDSILINTVVKERLTEICKTDTVIMKFVVGFYENTSCTRRYFKNYKSLKGVEHISERCENNHIETFIYEQSNNKWNLKYSKNKKYTIYCNKK